MELLTPTGYRPVEACQPGDAVVGAHGVNRIQSIQRVDESEWERWHKTVQCPDFLNYRINGDFDLFSEQSIFHNNGKVTHARLLRPGNVIFHRGRPVTVKRIRQIDARPWHRLEIDGDHSFIADGMRLHNASRFCKPGAGSADWTSSNTGIWAATSGGATGQSVPGSADTVTCDGNFGGGTCRVNFGGTITVQSITCGAQTGTLDFSVFNNSVTLSAASAFSGSGSGTRTINLGNGTWTMTDTSNGASTWTMTTTTNLTFSANSSILSFSGNSSGPLDLVFAGGGLTYATVTRAAQTSGGHFRMQGANTFTTLTIAGQNWWRIEANQTITNLNLNGTSSGQIMVASNTLGTQRTLTITTLTAAWCAFRDIVGSGTATNSFDLGDNSGITITAPSTGGGTPSFGLAGNGPSFRGAAA